MSEVGSWNYGIIIVSPLFRKLAVGLTDKYNTHLA